jgi:thiamine pyrophosphate-dependent acetolactate synthase large subunit-like protein
MESKSDQSQGISRRSFLTASAIGSGAATTGIASSAFGATLPDVDIPSVQIPKDIPKSLGEDEKIGEFKEPGMTGAEVFARLCKAENLAGLFCCPGNYTVINAIAAAGIPAYGGRTEGGMCSAADGFTRVTGEAVATSGTEGPGFTHMIMNIAAANSARSPLLVLASNTRISADDREAGIQTAYQQPTTEGMKKYGKRIISPNRVHEYGAYAFRQLKSGVPGPVHLDFPGEVARARFSDPSELTDYYDKSKYRTESRPSPSSKEMDAAVDLISKAARPLLVAGNGVFQRKAWDALKSAAEKNDLVVAESGPGRGHFGDDHRLSANTANDALMSADLVIFVGQYCMPSPGEYMFNPDVKTIRVHPEHDDLGRNWPMDVGIVSDEKIFLEELADRLPKKNRDTWVSEVAAARKAFEDKNDEYYKTGLKYSKETGTLHPTVIGQLASDFFYGGDIDPKQTVTTVGGWTILRNALRWTRAFRPGQHVNTLYQYAPIGPSMSMSFGTGAAVQQGVGPQGPYKGAPVLCIASDAGAAYSIMELDTFNKYQVPAVILVYNNNSWGMWPAAARSPRSMHMYLFQENIRYDKMAEGVGSYAEYATTPEQLTGALQRCYKMAMETKGATLINCQGLKEFTSAGAYPPGPPRNVEPGVGAYAH